MACIEIEDLSELAQQHIAVQNQIVENQKRRLKDMESEFAQTPEDNPRHAMLRDGIAKLRFYLHEEGKKTVEDRLAMMESLYTDRRSMVFRDLSTEGKPRVASLFGLPTIREMIDRSQPRILRELMVRATSLLMGGAEASKKTPVDFVDVEGMEVKDALANIIEYHHIYNNVFIDKNGRIQFKSFKFRSDPNRPDQLRLDIVPSYWNAEEHGGNTQFIALLDAVHSGEDPVTHMHFYEMNPEEVKQIKAKIEEDLPEMRAKAKARIPKREAELRELQARQQDPAAYEKRLAEEYDAAVAELKTLRDMPTGDVRKLPAEEKAARTARMDALKRMIGTPEKPGSLRKRLDQAIVVRSGKEQIAALEEEKAALEREYTEKNPNLSKKPYSGKSEEAQRLTAEVLLWRAENSEKRKRIKSQVETLSRQLKEAGDVEEDIRKIEKKIKEDTLISEMSLEKAFEMFDLTNGFFSFDKGSAEKTLHDKHRTDMNVELNKYLTREAIAYLVEQFGDQAREELEKYARAQYQQNLLARLESLAARVR